jgi:hypothetical protein
LPVSTADIRGGGVAGLVGQAAEETGYGHAAAVRSACSGNGRCQRRDSYGFRLLVGLDVKKTEALKKKIK